MGIKESIIEWRANKRERGRELAMMPEYERVHHINHLHDVKAKVKKNIGAMCCDMTMRDSLFSRFNEIQHDRWVHQRMKAKDSNFKPDAEFKRITRNRLSMVRIMRFNNGLPLVFGDYARAFWADPHSGYIPEDFLPRAISAGVEFHSLTFMMRPGRADHIVRNIWGKRAHRGYWGMYQRPSQDQLDAAGKPTKHVFMFESFTDVLDFRFHYEDDYEMVQAA